MKRIVALVVLLLATSCHAQPVPEIEINDYFLCFGNHPNNIVGPFAWVEGRYRNMSHSPNLFMHIQNGPVNCPNVGGTIINTYRPLWEDFSISKYPVSCGGLVQGQILLHADNYTTSALVQVRVPQNNNRCGVELVAINFPNQKAIADFVYDIWWTSALPEVTAVRLTATMFDADNNQIQQHTAVYDDVVTRRMSAAKQFAFLNVNRHFSHRVEVRLSNLSGAQVYATSTHHYQGDDDDGEDQL